MDATGPFPDPWFGLSESAAAIEAEARSEIAAGHELHGLALRAIAKCEGCDNVVFEVSDGTGAVLHLTWTQAKPEHPPWPRTDDREGPSPSKARWINTSTSQGGRLPL